MDNEEKYRTKTAHVGSNKFVWDLPAYYIKGTAMAKVYKVI